MPLIPIIVLSIKIGLMLTLSIISEILSVFSHKYKATKSTLGMGAAMVLVLQLRNRLISGRLIPRLGATPSMMLVTPSFLAAPICHGPGLEQKGLYLPPNVLHPITRSV